MAKTANLSMATKALGPLSPLRSVPEAAPLMGMSTKGLYGLIYRREIESVKVGRLRRVSERAIQEYLERNTTPALGSR